MVGEGELYGNFGIKSIPKLILYMPGDNARISHLL